MCAAMPHRLGLQWRLTFGAFALPDPKFFYAVIFVFPRLIRTRILRNVLWPNTAATALSLLSHVWPSPTLNAGAGHCTRTRKSLHYAQHYTLALEYYILPGVCVPCYFLIVYHELRCRGVEFGIVRWFGCVVNIYKNQTAVAFLVFVSIIVMEHKLFE